MRTLTWLVVGPERHGVTMHAARVAAQAPTGVGVTHDICRQEQVTTDRPDLTGRTVVAQVTDRLFGNDPLSAADTVVDVLSRSARATVVLHDVPQASDGRWLTDRSQGYRRIAAVATIVVGSEHERSLLGDIGIDPAGIEVVPLPIQRDPDAARRRDTLPHGAGAGAGVAVVATLGFLYPGKGDDDVIAAAAACPGQVRVINLGSAAAGHESLLQDYARLAEGLGLDWSCTGWLSDDDLAAAMSAATVPVAAHRHVSASGSINSWISAGRRPIVRAGTYTRELARRLPGSVLLSDDLTADIRAALADPELTWNLDGQIGPSWAQAARRLTDIALRTGPGRCGS